MKKWILYFFLIVISNPYEDIDYNKINVYDVNYCSGHCINEPSYDDQYMEEEDLEETDNIYKDRTLIFKS